MVVVERRVVILVNVSTTHACCVELLLMMTLLGCNYVFMDKIVMSVLSLNQRVRIIPIRGTHWRLVVAGLDWLLEVIVLIICLIRIMVVLFGVESLLFVSQIVFTNLSNFESQIHYSSFRRPFFSVRFLPADGPLLAHLVRGWGAFLWSLLAGCVGHFIFVMMLGHVHH